MTKEQRNRPERSEVQRKRKARRGADNLATYALRVAKHHAAKEAKKPKRR